MVLSRYNAIAIALVAGISFGLSASFAAPPEKPKKDKEKPDFPKFEEAMKDFKEVPTAEKPFFPLWYKKKTDELRAQIPGSMIGKQFLIATSMAGGAVSTGFQIDHFLAYFERMNKKLVLMRVDPRYVDGGSKPISDVIKRSYGADVILKTCKIVTMKGSDPIIDLDALFKSDFSRIGRWGGGTINSSLSKWAQYKAFPQNIELTADLAMMRGSTGRRTLFHYSLSKIPESTKGFKSRVADDRVGYFLTVRKDWSKDYDADSLFNRYINRWRLEKRDPSAELSAPKNPIIWYIEKTVPLKFRRWVKAGILEWNRAFEKCGFLDAIEVVQQEDYDPRTKDLDPEDVRHNFFRWIVTGRGFAMGPSRDHPLTGQIFDADIVFDDAMVRHYVTDYGRLTGGEETWEPYNPIVADFFAAHPEWTFRTPWQNLLPNIRMQNDPDAEFRRNLRRHLYKTGRPMCECAAGMTHQLAFARHALEAQGLGRSSDEFIGQIIKEVVMHEVGHCLGLRHNFKASTWLNMEEIEAHRIAGDANVGSVMDYNPAIVSVRGEEQGSFTTRSIGPYDYWAIEYGYRPAGKPYKDEKEMLGKIASRVAEAGLAYSTDEDTMSFISPDPTSNRFDMGSDVMEYAERQIRLTDSLLKDIQNWAVKDGQSYHKLRRAFRRIFGERARVSAFVARFPGGQYFQRDHKGDQDGRPPIRVVEAEKQRDSVAFVCKFIFAEDAFEIDPELLSHLAPGRFWHWDSDEFDMRQEVNIHDLVASAQFRCLFSLLNPFTIGRIHDNQVKFGENQDVYSLAEHIDSLEKEIWSELYEDDRRGTERKPFVTSFRRNLQRSHLKLLLNMVLTEPGRTVPADANALARLAVQNISSKIGRAQSSLELDGATKAHFFDVKKRIDGALEAVYTVGSGGRSGGVFFFHEAERAESEPFYVLPDK
ncbi:MAG: zinc-dependent metalloprotease [Planctomycetota bacterium]|nr:zinc-dependent metalloprotease [Planctomycetota bacterium]